MKIDWVFDPTPPSGARTGGDVAEYAFTPGIEVFVREVGQLSISGAAGWAVETVPAAFGTRKPMPISSTKAAILIIVPTWRPSWPASSRGIISPPLLALLYDFAHIRNRPYLIRSKFILHAAWML